MTDVWLHSKSPPQHIACVPEGQISTAAKMAAYMAQTNANRLTNLKWCGAVENERGIVTLHLFWNIEDAHAYLERNAGKLDLLTSTDD